MFQDGHTCGLLSRSILLPEEELEGKPLRLTRTGSSLGRFLLSAVWPCFLGYHGSD